MAGAVSACSKGFLEPTPKGFAVAQNVVDYDKLLDITTLNSSYDPEIGIMMGDEAVAIDPTLASVASNATYQHLLYGFEWATDVYQPTEHAGEMYAFLGPVYTYNKVINEVMSAADSAGDTESPAAIRAEAMADRAWSYLWLINYFGAPYSSASSGTDPGFPIVTASDVTTTAFSRGTVEGTYQFIVQNLAGAIPWLPLSVTNKYRMSRPAAEAILGKAYWFMGKYDSALTELDAAFADLAQNTGQPVALYNLAVEMTPTGAYSYVAGTTNKLYITGFSNSNTDKEAVFAKPFYCLNAEWGAALAAKTFTSLFDSSDLRLDFYSTLSLGGASAVDTAGDLRRIGPFYCNIYGVNLPDMYLMRAECEARTGAMSAAIADLQALRQTRMASADAAVAHGMSQNELIVYVIQERLREFGLLGMRWFDMRRLSGDPLFSGATYTHLYRSASGPQTFTLQQPQRFTLRFPTEVINDNPGMVNNP